MHLKPINRIIEFSNEISQAQLLSSVDRYQRLINLRKGLLTNNSATEQRSHYLYKGGAYFIDETEE